MLMIEIDGCRVMIANPVPEWVSEPGYEWFGEAYGYASNCTRAIPACSKCTRAIPACSKCTPEELFYFLCAALHELDLLAGNPNEPFGQGVPVSRIAQVLAAHESRAAEQITAPDR